MRRIHCDPYEFDPPDSEQTLDLAIAAPSKRLPNLAALFAEVKTPNAQRLPPLDRDQWRVVASHLAEFAGVSVPDPSAVRDAIVLQNDPDAVEIGIEFGSYLVWYRWFSSA